MAAETSTSKKMVRHTGDAAALRPPKEGWTYAPAPEAKDHVRLKPRYELFVGGKWIEPHSGKHFATLNPGDETAIAEVADADEHDVDLAVKAARDAYEKVW